MNLVVLASGRGSRLGRITKNKPKCLVKVNKKKTILDHISENFYLFEKVIIVTGYKAQILKNKYRKKKQNLCTIKIMPQQIWSSP